jgi:hypothetical protein
MAGKSAEGSRVMRGVADRRGQLPFSRPEDQGGAGTTRTPTAEEQDQADAVAARVAQIARWDQTGY